MNYIFIYILINVIILIFDIFFLFNSLIYMFINNSIKL